MPYNITLSNGSDLITGGLLDNTLDTSNSSLSLVGKNYKSYGLFVNQNFVRLLENFAKSTAPAAPLPGQIWFNSSTKLLNLNISATKGTASAIWKTIAGLTYSATTPTDPYQGELWYHSTDGQLYIYTGTSWRIIGPVNKISTGNSGVIPDVVSDAPPSTTYVILKFLIDNVLVGIWSKDGPFNSDIAGFTTVKKGLNLHSTLGHTFWGNSEVANSIYVNNVAVAGNAFLRGDISSTINGSLVLTDDGGITFGEANDFVGNVFLGTVTLKNQTNNKDFILSLKSGGNQTPFFRGNHITGLAEAYVSPTSLSPSLSFTTKGYVDALLGTGGTATFFGDIVPNTNNSFTVGNVSNRFSNLFAVNGSITNAYFENTFVTVSNVAAIYISADIIPVLSNVSNIGSSGMQFNALTTRSAQISNGVNIGGNLVVESNSTILQSSFIGSNLTVNGNILSTASTPSISNSTGALIVSGGVGIGGNTHIGGVISNPLLTVPTSGTASLVGNLSPATNVAFTLGNVSNRWQNIFSENLLVGNINSANIVTATSNITLINLSGDLIPTSNIISNIGSLNRQFNVIHSKTLTISENGRVNGNLNVGINLDVAGSSNIVGDMAVSGNTTLTTNLTVSGAVILNAGTPSTSTTTGVMRLSGGAGITGNLNVGGTITTPTLPTGTANTAVATTAFVLNNVLPSGSLMMWPTVTAPTGWLLCNGQAVNRTTFATLFAVIGTTFGIGNGTTTFNVPNYTNRGPVGAGGLYAVGATGGSKDATLVSHTHSVTGTFVTAVNSTSTVVDGAIETTSTSVLANVSTSTGSSSVASTGSSATDANMPPYLAINFIIKT